MTFIDTNYFLRFLLEDIDSQSQEAKKLLRQGSEGSIKLITSTIVIFEIYWVLMSYYEKGKQEVVTILEKLLQLTFITLDEREILQKSIHLFQISSFDLEDCYNLFYATSKHVKEFKTFDTKLTRMFISVQGSTR